MASCPRCGEPVQERAVFCPSCGAVVDLEGLRGQRIVGFVGAQSTNPKVEQFWETGDPSVFAKPGAPDYRGG